ncbi:MAG: thioesterase family protein [Acidimicrobiales bacterium]|jgi:acyl-coenzyme A thioesterase PaaI-like protein
MADDALFRPDGAQMVPTEFARGPWTPDALHGGPVAALAARAIESVPTDDPMHVTRLTLELLRPVPLVPLTVSTSVSRPGRKVQIVDTRISDGERDVAWGRGLRIRLQPADFDAPASSGPVPGVDPGAPPGPAAGYTSPAPLASYRAFHNAGAELQYVAGVFSGRGPATVWVRLAVPVVPGEEPTPLQRAVAAADFGNGVSSELDFDHFVFVNPDLTVYLHRPAVGEWICLDATTRIGIPGVGVAQSALWDVHGPIGRSVQSLLVERRG